MKLKITLTKENKDYSAEAEVYDRTQAIFQAQSLAEEVLLQSEQPVV